MQKEVPPNNPNTSITHSQISPLLRGVYKRLRAFAFRVPYAAFLLWPTICFYYSIYSYQPYRVFLARIIIYALINLIVYGVAYLLAGSRERATVGTVLFFVSPWILPERVQVFWKVHPEALLIPIIIIFPLLRLLRIGRRIEGVIHLAVAMLMILLHFRLGVRWVRDTAQLIARSAFAALYTSWELPDSIRQAFLQAANHQDLGRIVLQIANPVSKQVSAPCSRMEGPYKPYPCPVIGNYVDPGIGGANSSGVYCWYCWYLAFL
jgi:hypothetical protein